MIKIENIEILFVYFEYRALDQRIWITESKQFFHIFTSKNEKHHIFEKVDAYLNRKSLQLEKLRQKTETRSKMMLREGVHLQIE